MADQSGSCGANLTWEYIEDWATLIISGSGAMTDYASADAVPWYDLRDQMFNLLIGKDVTHIGNYAFYENCFDTVYEGDTIDGEWSQGYGSSLVSIGDYAFAESVWLGFAEMPGKLTTIGAHAFENCSWMWRVSLPESVTSIGQDAFAGCNDIEDVWIFTTGEISFPEDAFMGTPTFHVYSGSPALSYASRIGCPFVKIDGRIEKITIPASITTIESEAFADLPKTAFVIPKTVTSIADDAFMNTDTILILEEDSYAAGWAEGHAEIEVITVPAT